MGQKIKAVFKSMNANKILKEKSNNDNPIEIEECDEQEDEGDNEEERPGGFDFKAAAKYNAWLMLKGKSKEEASTAYIELVTELSGKYL
jgi:acyl-CoA-binding protein